VGEGLRSVEVTPSPNQERVLYPARRSPFIEPGLSGSGLYTALGLPWVALCPPLGARPSLCTLEALRGTLSGATMTIPGGSGTLWATSSPCSAHRLLSYGRSSHVTGLRPFALPHPDALSPLAPLSPGRRGDLCPRTPAHNTRRYEHSLFGVSWPTGVGLGARDLIVLSASPLQSVTGSVAAAVSQHNGMQRIQSTHNSPTWDYLQW
jgi:hypothetical protein